MKTTEERRAENKADMEYFRGFLEKLSAITSKGDAMGFALMQIPSHGFARQYHANLSSFLDTYKAPRDASIVELTAYSELFDRIAGNLPLDARENVQRQLAAEIARRKAMGAT